MMFKHLYLENVIYDSTELNALTIIDIECGFDCNDNEY